MNKLHQKIMSTAFSKWLKRLIIVGLRAALLVGGAASTFLLQPQIREGIQAAQTWKTQEHEWPQDAATSGWGHRWNRDTETDDWKSSWHGDFDSGVEDNFAISELSTGAKIAVFATGALCGLLAVAVWLLIALWLYQAAVQSNMNGILWMLLGLVWNLAAATLFLVVRRFIREKCPDCGGSARSIGETAHGNA